MNHMTSEALEKAIVVPIISVIVPVFNVEKYLPQCIESILAQSFTLFELILVDDGSTDMSGAICNEFSGKDNRIQVIQTENSGVSAARNTGIEIAQGKYITFVDSDDFVDSKLLEKMIQAIEINGSDACLAGFAAYYSNNSQIEHVLSCEGHFLMADFVNDYFGEAYKKDLLSGPCNKLFRAKIIQTYDLRYETNYSICEDGIFSYSYLCHCQTVSLVPYVLYFYRQRVGESHLMNGYHHNAFDALATYYFSIVSFLGEHKASENEIKVVDRNFLNRYIDYLSTIYRESDLSDAGKYSELLNQIRDANFQRLIHDVPSSALSLRENVLILLISMRKTKVIHWYWTYRHSEQK